MAASTQLAISQVRPPILAARVTPRAPRSIIQIGSLSFESILGKISRDGAERLYPRLALFEALSGFKDKHKPRQRSDDVICEARRDFLDSFAYLCDVEKGGKTVTATALQKLLVSDFLWLAANEGIRDDIMDYAHTILARLKTITLQNRTTIQDEIFKLAVDKCQPRIKFYKAEVLRYARNCRMTLRHREKGDIGKSLSFQHINNDGLS